MRTLAVDLIDVLFSVDSRLWRTVRDLTVDPGGMVRRYLEGQRMRYVNPLRYAIVNAALWWLVVAWALRGVDLTQLAPALQVQLRYGQVINVMLLPLLALSTWIAFAGGPFGYVQHLCVSLFVFGHVFLWRVGLALLGPWLPQWTSVINRTDSIVCTIYLALALFFCFRQRVRWLLPRIVLALVLISLLSGTCVAQLARWLST